MSSGGVYVRSSCWFDRAGQEMKRVKLICVVDEDHAR